jgi:ankyrin repeat protein
LLDKGTDGDTALNKALSVGNKEIVQAIFKKLFATSNLPILKDALLVNNDYGASPLHNLVLASDEIFQEVIELARDNNALEALLIPKAGESTALHFAAYEEMTGNIAKILKESGKVVGLQKSVLLAKNSDSVTPLYIAIETDKVEVVNAVMALTDVDILKEVFSYKSNTGDTVLHAANTRNVKEVKKAMYEKVLSHKDLLETLVIKDSFGATALNNLALAEKELFEEIFQTAKANNLLKDLLALEVDGANLLAMARDEADAASGAEKAKLDSVVSIIEIEMDVSPRTEEEKVLPDAKVITPIETMDIVHDTQLAAIESFANAHFKDVIVAEVHKPINTIKKAYDLAEATAVNADQQFKAYVVPTVTGPLKGKVKKQVQKINQQPKMDVQAQLQRAAGDADRQAKALKVELDNAKAFKAKLEAPFYLKTGIYLSQGADFIETAAYVSKKLGYEPSNGTSNAIYYGHDFLEILAGAAMLKGGGGISSVVGSIGQTNVVNNLVSNYASNSVLVNGVTIAASGVVAGVIGGVPLAIVSVALPVLNLGLNKLIEYNKISSDNALVKVAQPILTLAPQIMGAYYNPYAVGKVVASINIIKTADELGALGLIYDQLPTWEVAKEFVLSHPFADAAVVTEAFSVLTFSLGKTAALTSFGVAAPWFFGIGAAFAATEVAYQKGAFGLIKNYTYDQLPTWEVATNTTGEFLGNHPVGSVGALSGVAAAVTKFVPAIAAKAGGASPYLAVLSAASIVGDAAYSYEAIPGAGIAAALVTVGGLLAYGPGLPVAAAVTAAAALGGLAEYGYETYVGDHSKVEKTIFNGFNIAKEFIVDHPAGVGGGVVEIASVLALKASYVTTGAVVMVGGAFALAYDLYNSAYNTLGGVFAGGASVSTLGAGIGGLIGTAAGFFGGGAGAIAGGAYGAKIGSVAGATLGAIGGGLAEYGNNNWYYQISDDAKFPILTSLKYSATDIFNKIKDLSDAEIRQSYNDLITKFYNDKYKGAAKKMHCQGDDISADMAKETSGLRSELKLIHYYASSMLGKAGINGGLLFQYKTLEPNYNGEKSDEDIFYSSLKTDGGYLGLSGNGYGKVVDLSKKIRKADAATEKMKTAYPESITEEAVACMVNQYASNSTAVMVDVFGVCVDQFNFDCPTA